MYIRWERRVSTYQRQRRYRYTPPRLVTLRAVVKRSVREGSKTRQVTIGYLGSIKETDALRGDVTMFTENATLRLERLIREGNLPTEAFTPLLTAVYARLALFLSPEDAAYQERVRDASLASFAERGHVFERECYPQ